MTRFFPITLGFLFVGCTSAQFVQKEYNPRRGIVSYLANLNEVGTKTATKAADKKIREFCEGDYVITRESENLESIGSSGAIVGNIAVSRNNSQPYHYVQFNCSNQKTVQRTTLTDSSEK